LRPENLRLAEKLQSNDEGEKKERTSAGWKKERRDEQKEKEGRVSDDQGGLKTPRPHSRWRFLI